MEDTITNRLINRHIRIYAFMLKTFIPKHFQMVLYILIESYKRVSNYKINKNF